MLYFEVYILIFRFVSVLFLSHMRRITIIFSWLGPSVTF